MVGRGLFQVWFHPVTWSTLNLVGIKPGDSGIVIGYQVDEFIHALYAEPFLACLHNYPLFMGKMSSLNHFPLEPMCEDYSFLDHIVADSEFHHH